MYKIKELASIANISTRTLRHYDTIGLLSPKRDTSSTYRLYSEDDINILQSILFYKELGYELKEIKKIISEDDFDVSQSLDSMEQSISNKIDSLHRVLDLIKKTKLNKKGVIKMTNKEKFEAFKEKQLQENNAAFGSELSEKYEHDFVKKANQQYKNKTKSEMSEHEAFTVSMHDVMKKAVLSNNPSNDISQQMCDMHKKWLLFYWPSYSKEAHLGLCEMYTQDERFTKHYEDIQKGLSKFLLEAMKIYIK